MSDIKSFAAKLRGWGGGGWVSPRHMDEITAASIIEEAEKLLNDPEVGGSADWFKKLESWPSALKPPAPGSKG
jgi:hypothetical protein